MSKKERETCELEMDFKKSLLLPSSLSNDDIISSRSGLKTRVKNDVFWSEIGRHTSTKNSLKHPAPPPRVILVAFCVRERLTKNLLLTISCHANSVTLKSIHHRGIRVHLQKTNALKQYSLPFSESV